MFLLAAVFAAIPAILYGRFHAAEVEKRQAVLHTLQAEGRLIAQSLQMALEAPRGAPVVAAQTMVERLDPPDLKIRLLFRPAQPPEAGVFLVAAKPAVPEAALDAERRELVELGVARMLPADCSAGGALDQRFRSPAGAEEILTSATSFATRAGCWVVVTSHGLDGPVGAFLARPWWDTPQVQLAALAYIMLAVLVLAVVAAFGQSLRRFGQQARAIASGHGEGTFESRNTVPELAGVASEFDRMVGALRAVAQGFRFAAEDNAHAFKTPIATISQAIEPLKKAVPADDLRARRSLDLIDASVARLDALVTAARRMDQLSADLLTPPREPVDLSDLMRALLASYDEAAAERDITIARRIDENCVVLAGEELLETVTENLLDNALSFTPTGGVVSVTVSKDAGTVMLRVEDEGPGVPDDVLPSIFERYLSHRPEGSGEPGQHFGVGLWIVRRNVTAIGGRIEAVNRPEGGFRVSILLPLATH